MSWDTGRLRRRRKCSGKGPSWLRTASSARRWNSFPGFPVEDKRHAALVKVKPVTGAFTLEMWIQPKTEFKPEQRCFLLDKKYVEPADYQWQIGEAAKSGLRRMWVTLGFGAESKSIYSEPLSFEPGVWQHVAFTYDGAGTGRFIATAWRRADRNWKDAKR